MRRARRAVACSVFLASALVACVDLFHSTSFETACDVDAAACASPDASTTPFPAEFCAWSRDTARAHADRACAWLGACASTAGENAFGPCVVRARLAYDCASNPDRRLRPGPAHDVWDHLWRATSCADVLAALLPNTVTNCAGGSASYTGCAPGGSTLVSCNVSEAGVALAPGFESCTALGQTCVTAGRVASCAGSSSSCQSGDAGATCASGTQLADCDPDASGAEAFDHGVDCASVGAGACAEGAPAACLATGDAGCARSADVTCSGGLAIGCPSGLTEQVDCTGLLGVAGCSASAEGRAWDVSRACTAAVACPGDSCAGDSLSSCTRGAVFQVDCASVGIGTCVIDPLTQRGACAPEVVENP